MDMQKLEETIITSFKLSHGRKPTKEEMDRIAKDIVMLLAIQPYKE